MSKASIAFPHTAGFQRKREGSENGPNQKKGKSASRTEMTEAMARTRRDPTKKKKGGFQKSAGKGTALRKRSCFVMTKKTILSPV